MESNQNEGKVVAFIGKSAWGAGVFTYQSHGGGNARFEFPKINGPDQSTIKAVETFEYPSDTINAPHQSWGEKRIDLCKSESPHLMPLLDTPSRAPKSYHKTEEAAGNIPANKHIVALNNII